MSFDWGKPDEEVHAFINGLDCGPKHDSGIRVSSRRRFIPTG